MDGDVFKSMSESPAAFRSALRVRTKFGTLFSNHNITIPQLLSLKVSNEIQLESDLTFVKQ